MGRFHVIRFLVAILLANSLEAISVNPSLCPTNKIAPHKRIANWEYGTGRTFGAFYDLLAPGNPYDGPNYPNDLQEQPQEDDPSDCGEIDDYDENDLSSITPQRNRRQGYRDSRVYGFNLFGSSQDYPNGPEDFPERPSNPPERPPNRPQRPPYRPQKPPNSPQRPPNRPQRPPNHHQKPPSYPRPRPPFTNRPPLSSYPAARPPYWSGGLFGSNEYRPPQHQNPSDNIKPIHEYSEDGQVTYRPSVVGGSLGHVVGVSPIVPGPASQDDATTVRTFYDRFRTTSHNQPTGPRGRNLNNKILGSFVDLLF